MRSAELAGDVASMLFGYTREGMRSASGRREHRGERKRGSPNDHEGSVVGDEGSEQVEWALR